MATLLNYGFTTARGPSFPNQRSGPQQPLPPIPTDVVLQTFRPLGTESGNKRPEKDEQKACIWRDKISAAVGEYFDQAASSSSPRDVRLVPAPLFSDNTSAEKHFQQVATGGTSNIKGLHEAERIKQILEGKQLGALVFQASDSSKEALVPNSANSMVDTPIELYDRSRRPTLSLKTTMALQEPEFRLTPIETDLGALAVIASLPDSKPSSINGRHSLVGLKLPGGSVVTLITPEQSAWQRTVYLPGPIRLESYFAAFNSALTPLDWLHETAGTLGFHDRNTSDDAIMDDMVSFFEAYGANFKSANTGFDAFWMDSPDSADASDGLQVADWPLQDTCVPDAAPQLPSWYQNLPGESFNFAGKAFNYPSTDSSEWQRRSSAVSSAQRSETSSKILPYSPAFPSSPLPPLPTVGVDISRKSKAVGKRAPPVSATPRMSFRRLISSASAIV